MAMALGQSAKAITRFLVKEGTDDYIKRFYGYRMLPNQDENEF